MYIYVYIFVILDIFNMIFMEEAPFYWLFERGGSLLFIWSKTMQAVVWSFILWSVLYLEG